MRTQKLVDVKSCLDNLPLKVLQGQIQMAALRPCVPHPWCSARFETPGPFSRAFQIWYISRFARLPKHRFLHQKGFLSEVFIFGGENCPRRAYCFWTETFSEVFLLGVGGNSLGQRGFSGRFSLAGVWANRVSLKRGPLARDSTVEEMFVKGFVKKTPEKLTFIPQPLFSLFFAN